MPDWRATRNLAGLDQGNFRSILGYAGESLVIGRALVAGYNLFFKAWRDSKYDAVLDHGGQLFRIEIKQSGDGKQISCTSGGRSGQQISRETASREVVLSPDDSEFLIGVHSMSGKCWIIPTEVVWLRKQASISTGSLDLYLERWDIFTSFPASLSLEDLRVGFRKRDLETLMKISQDLGLDEEPQLYINFPPRTRRVLHRREDWYVLKIWEKIFQYGQTQ